MNKIKKHGVFDKAVEWLEAWETDENLFNIQERAELRAAIAVLKACESCDITDESIGLGLSGSMRVCRAILRARKIAARREK